MNDKTDSDSPWVSIDGWTKHLKKEHDKGHSSISWRELAESISELIPDKRKYDVNALPGTIENRVFIGGDYNLMPVLGEIKKYVLKLKRYQPILAADFDIPRDKTRDYSMRLLYQCRYAIFEVTTPGGQLLEAQEAVKCPGIKPLFVFMAQDKNKNPPESLSTMLIQISPPPKGYVAFSELEKIIVEFLSGVAIE